MLDWVLVIIKIPSFCGEWYVVFWYVGLPGFELNGTTQWGHPLCSRSPKGLCLRKIFCNRFFYLEELKPWFYTLKIFFMCKSKNHSSIYETNLKRFFMSKTRKTKILHFKNQSLALFGEGTKDDSVNRILVAFWSRDS